MPKTGRRERASEWLHRLDPVAHPILFALAALYSSADGQFNGRTVHEIIFGSADGRSLEW
jgi:hypothetical protein